MKRKTKTFAYTERLLRAYPHIKQSVNEPTTAVLEGFEFHLSDSAREAVFLYGAKTKWLIDTLETALESISNDKYFFLIEEKYFNQRTDEELSAILAQRKEEQPEIFSGIGTAERTIRAHKKRLVEVVELRIFGTKALETHI